MKNESESINVAPSTPPGHGPDAMWSPTSRASTTPVADTQHSATRDPTRFTTVATSRSRQH